MSSSPEKQPQPQPASTGGNVEPDAAALALTSSTSNSADPLTCQWSQCRERCTSPEALYDHVCERHVGRKSTNNLNLQCAWGNCRTTTVKRDHITSHIRVHVPLKPHKCEICGKSFKRPQDLKKHVKTHADESVILRSPEPSISSQKPSNVQQSYTHSNARQNGYYQDPHGHVSGGSYGYPQAVTQHGHYGQSVGHNQPNYNPSYGPVYYPHPQGFAATGFAEGRKRGFDDLNDFFGDVKRRQIDATQYQDLGSRFSSVMAGGGSMPMSGFQAGYQAGLRAAGSGGMLMDENMGGGAAAYTSSHVPSMQSQYMQPFAELKTKNDLMTIDHFLEQLQHTVYENPEPIATAGAQTLTGMSNSVLPNNFRAHNSPPHILQSTASSSGSATTPDTYPGPSAFGTHSMSSALDDNTSTPALTPSSYAAASHSPASSQTNISPVTRPANTATGAALYPTLPSFSTLNADANGYSGYNGNAAPLSNLGPSYDEHDNHRRYSGGFLQRARPVHASVATTMSRSGSNSTSPTDQNSKSPTTSPSSRRSSIEISKPLRQVALSGSDSSRITLPSVAELTRDTERESQREREVEEKQEAWVRNMRVIEDLRNYVKSRLEKGEFAEEEAAGAREESNGAAQRDGGLYPVLKPISAAS